MEEYDGITRRVTLDKQYRMHPLGSFISHASTERFDPTEHFGSGRPVSDFAHAISSTNGKPAVWLDVPAQIGRHQKDGTSWTRPAKPVIVRKLNEWMSSDEGKGLSFGVISFYKAQADLIRKPEVRNIADDDKKLRVGTVDSFQGMEFDVVFLSMVRTMPSRRVLKPVRGE